MARIRRLPLWIRPLVMMVLFLAPAYIAAVTMTGGVLSGGLFGPSTSGAQSSTLYIAVPAGAVSTDGTECQIPLEVTIGTWSKKPTIVCNDDDASTMEFSIPRLTDWDAGTVTLSVVVVQDDASAGALHMDATSRCVGDTETPGAYPSEVAIDIATITGTDARDVKTSAAMTPAGTCAAGDTLEFRIQIDATGTTTDMEAVSDAARLHILGFEVARTSA